MVGFRIESQRATAKLCGGDRRFPRLRAGATYSERDQALCSEQTDGSLHGVGGWRLSMCKLIRDP